MEEEREEQIDIRDYLRVIRKRKWTVISAFTIIVFTVLIYSFTSTPVYEATTRLIIERENPKVVSFQEVMAVDASGTDYYQTQYKIIESRTLAKKVIEKLHLRKSEEFSPKPKDTLIGNLKRSIHDTYSAIIKSIGSLLKRPSTMESSESEEKDQKIVNNFLSRIKVRPIRRSRLVDVSFQAKDPVLATKIVNTLAESYIDLNLEIRLKAAQDAVRWLYDRIEKERKKVENAELALQRYREKYGIITDFSTDTEKITAQKLAKLNAQVIDAESRRVEAETRYRQALALRGNPDMLDSIPEVLNNKLIREIKSMEVELYNRMSELSKKYGQRHPKMVAIQSELKTLQKRKRKEIERVINSLKNNYMVALARERTLKAAFLKQKKQALELNKKAIEYGVLKREAESAKQMYELLIKRFKETSIAEDMKTGNIRVVDKAEVPRFPVSPKKKMNFFISIVVGLFMGIGLAFFFEYLDNTIKTPEELKQYIKIPYLGPVPFISGQEAGENPEGKRMLELMTFHSPKSVASEAYRGIRTGILFSSAELEPRVILITSAAPNEGKTISTTNLAITMAQSGNRVIMLDCDLRRPKLHRIFKAPSDKGITNLIVGNTEIKEAIFSTHVPGLDVIPCGPIPPNPSEILGSRKMHKLLEALKKNYRRIIIDSPPINVVTDAVVLAKSVDGVVIVIRSNDTPREVVKNGLNQLQAVRANILGAILNCVPTGRDSYYYYHYYYYYYGEEKKRKRHKRKSGNPV